MDNPERVTYFAATDSRGKYVPFGIKSKDRDRHLYVIGKTGMGKSTMLENMAIQDIRNGEGLCFIDPHGGTVDRLLDYIPEERIDDVVYFAPFDLDHPIAFNVMEDVGYDRRHLVVSGLMATFKKIWEDAWSARMEYILTNTLLALLEYPGATLLGVNRMYTDKEYRKKVVENIKDPLVRDFWTKEFATYTDRYTQEATPAIQNKVGQFTGNPLIRNVIGQPKSSFDIREMMDKRKILLINLSKGLIGETNMNLLGSMLTTRLFLAAMSRANLPASELAKQPHFYFYVDEFQNFANKTFAEILSESRKYKLNLTITHQYIEQMEEEVRDAVFGNVGTTVSFRVGPFDAEVLETVFAPRFMKEDIVLLDKRQIYLTLMIDGVGSTPFSAVTLPPIEPPPVSHKQQVVERSRALHTNARQAVEEAIIAELTPVLPIAVEQPKKSDFRPESRAPSHQKPQASQRPRDQRERTEPSRPMLRPTPKGESKPPSEHRQVSEPPKPRVQTADDLKAILRSMTKEHTKTVEKQQQEHKQELKGTLTSVLKEIEPPQQVKEVAAPLVVPELPPATPPEPAPVAATVPAQPQAPAAPPERTPFEVPEAELRKALNGE